jgi:hypothetical protein
MELNPKFFFHSFFDGIAEFEYIFPGSFCIIDEKIPMSFAYVNAANTSSFESRLVDKLTSTQ